jgi:DNA-binding NtrC family response regulator
MSQTLYILHALSEKTDPHLLLDPISTNFSAAVQDRAETADLLVELRRKPYSLLFLDSEFRSNHTVTQLVKKIEAEFTRLCIILIVNDHLSETIPAGPNSTPFFFLTQPIEPAEVTFCVNHCKMLLKHRRLTEQQRANNKPSPISGFIGKSPPMRELFDIIGRVAADDFSTVLIRGESGTGKELVAKAIHAKSSRRKHNFVPVNCAAIPDELLESELFGHLKGSFTGAGQNKTGRIQYADNGTLFLDEIGDMKPNLQAKLLRVIQEREFEPVGSLKATPVNTRIVAATHCDLEQLVSEGSFREDLYYRLSVIPLEVPPLRERVTDIPLLLDKFIDQYTIRRGRDKITFSPEAIDILINHPWNGNVRELENVVQHMSILYCGKRIHPHHLPPKFNVRHGKVQTSPTASLTSSQQHSIHDISAERADLFSQSKPPAPSVNFDNGPINFNELINEFETELIIEAMKFTSGNKKEASRILGLKRTTLLEKIKKKRIEGRWEK